jgi:hypothetical protein
VLAFIVMSTSMQMSGSTLKVPKEAHHLMLEGGKESWQHPPSFYCPILQQVMHDPVVLSDGHSYERRHIERWLQDHCTSPVSNEKLLQKTIFPNHALRNAIEEYFEQVFSVHRRAICNSIEGGSSSDFVCNEPLICTIDALMQCSFLMNADLSTECVVRNIMEQARNLLGAEAASVFLVDASRQELYSTVNSTGGELRLPINAGIAGHVASTGEALVIPDAYSDDRFDSANDLRTGFTTCNMICAPLKLKKGVVIGVVQLINKTCNGAFCRSQVAATCSEDFVRPAFTPDDLQFLRVFASQAASAVANSGGVHEASVQPQPQVYHRHNDDDIASGTSEQKAFGAGEDAYADVSKTSRLVTTSCPKESRDAPQSLDSACQAGRKKSGRARQRAAKFWAKTRSQTPERLLFPMWSPSFQ